MNQQKIVVLTLGEILKARGLTVREASVRVGMTRAGLYSILEAPPVAIRLKTIQKLCAGLNVEPADLLVLRPAKSRRS